ncbi:MAG: hypothetical protein U0840_19125 [Gemmataceae bacterium]
MQRGSAIVRTLAEYLAAVALCGLLLIWLYDLPHRDLSVPLEYGGDALDSLVYARTLADHASLLRNPDLGAPHGLTLHDYQRAATLQLGCLYALSWLTPDPGTLVNLYFLLTFPLAAVVCLAVLRHLGASYLPALTASLLFAFLPYHHQRGIAHLFLSGYFLVPLGCLLAFWVYEEAAFFAPRDENTSGRWRPTGRGIVALVCALLIGSTEIYYAYFTCFFVGIAALAAAWRRGSRWPSLAGLLLIALIALAVLGNLSPRLLHGLEHGRNFEAGIRTSGDAHHFDLRLCQLLAPVTDHRLPLLARAKASLNSRIPGVTENDFASLGILGSVGFLYLLARLLPWAEQPTERTRRLQTASTLTIAGVLLGTMGGFSVLIASVFPMIRCYNRLSVFLAFLALFALAHLLESLFRRTGRLAALPLCLGLMLAGAWEQTPRATGTIDPALTALVASDRALVAEIERRAPQGGLVFQLPYVPYPEGGSYDHLRLSIHARQTRWSFPAMRGRYAALWQQHVAELPLPEMLDHLSWAGFAGLCCDAQADPQQATALAKLLGPALPDAKGRFLYFDLAARTTALRANRSEAEIEARQQAAREPVLLCWTRGFQQGGPTRPGEGRWGNQQSHALLLNPGTQPTRATVELAMESSPAGPATLQVSGPGLDQEVPLAPQTSRVRFTVEAPPGRSLLKFHCVGPCHPSFSRRYFRVVEYRVAPAPTQHAQR